MQSPILTELAQDLMDLLQRRNKKALNKMEELQKASHQSPCPSLGMGHALALGWSNGVPLAPSGPML
jgi:hypothetical protein